MSFLTILTMISLTVPGIAKLVQKLLMNFIYLDILQTELWFIPWLFPPGSEMEKYQQKVDEEETETFEALRLAEYPLSNYFDENGFSSHVLLKNLGSSTFYIAILFLLLILIPIFSGLKGVSPVYYLLNPNTLYSFKKWSLYLKKKFLWNGILRFLLQQFSPIFMGSLLNVFQVRVFAYIVR